MVEHASDQDRRRFLTRVGFGVAVAGVSGSAIGTAGALAQRPPELTVAGMIGKKLRVVKPGMFVTQEFDADRVTITVYENERMKPVRIG